MAMAWRLASGVWLGLESGHSSQKKTAPERVGQLGADKNGYAHLHLEIRPEYGAHSWINPLYFFTPQALSSANLTFLPYENESNEWRIYGYTSEVGGVYGYYWEGTIPEIRTKLGRIEK